MKILIVDDSKLVRLMLKRKLAKLGLSDIDEAASGAEALEALTGVDVVLTDLMMPGMTGVEVLKAIRERPDGANIVVILNSGHDFSAEERASYVQEGFDGLIGKQSGPEEIKSLAEAALRSRRPS